MCLYMYLLNVHIYFHLHPYVKNPYWVIRIGFHIGVLISYHYRITGELLKEVNNRHMFGYFFNTRWT